MILKGAFTHTRREAMPRAGRECKRVLESQNLSSEEARGEAGHAALLATLCNMFIVEPYTHMRGKAARNTILFHQARVILSSESQSLHSKF